jgi:putative ABC transport system permease protein
MFVFPDAQQRGGHGVVLSRQVKLTWEDGQAIRDQVQGIKMITPVIMGSEVVKYRDRSHRPEAISGVNEDYPEVANHTVDRGRFISRIDLQHRRKVAVLGQEIVDELNLGADPIGKEVYIGSLPVTVIGVMEERGQALGRNRDDLAFLPFDAALTLFGREAGDQVQLQIQADAPEVVEEVKDGVQRVLRQRHRIERGEPDDFQVIMQDEILTAVNRFLGVVTAVVGGVVSIALLVGGIGIMNIMLVSVTERTREIGIRLAIGAQPSDVMMQFLVEAVVLSVLGGAIGIVLGGAVALLMPVVAGWATVLPWNAVLLAFGVSAAIGVVFGVYPARRAAQLDPIVALRHE